MEVSFGKNRGISMTAKKGAVGTRTYTISPNPHNADSKWYNKNQAAYYKQAAVAIAIQTRVSGGKAEFPDYGTKIDVHNVEYTLAQR